jgi:hypothetical protein
VENAYRSSNNLYILNDIKGEKCYMRQMNERWLWHRRVSHMNFDNIVKIITKQAVKGIPNIANLQTLFARMPTWKKYKSKLQIKGVLNNEAIGTRSYRYFWAYRNTMSTR